MLFFLTKIIIHLLIKFVRFRKTTFEILFVVKEELLLIKITYGMKKSDMELLKMTLFIKNEEKFLISIKNEILESKIFPST